MKKVYSLVDCRISEKCENSLRNCGFSVIKLPKMESLSAPIASHTDMLLFKVGKAIFASEEYFSQNPMLYAKLREALPHIDFRLTEDSQKKVYPHDAIFNGLILGNCLFCKTDSFSADARKYAEDSGIKTVPVKQGYPACTTLKLSDNAAITADHGMAAALIKEGIDVTLIENGDISLPPYSYGFIGGAGGVFEDTVYFFGDIYKHRSAEKIIEALNRLNMKACSLSDEPLADLGGILFVSDDIYGDSNQRNKQ